MENPVFETLNKTFSIYKLSGKVTGCYCDLCLSKEYSDFLISTPLSLLNQNDFAGYLYSVDILQNDCNDFKYFLPRLLELAYTMDEGATDFNSQFWTVLGRTYHQNWPDQERIILQDFAKIYMDKARTENGETGNETAKLDLEEAGISIQSK